MRRNDIRNYFAHGRQRDKRLREGKLGRMSGNKSTYDQCDLSGLDLEFLNFLDFFTTDNVNRRRLEKDKVEIDKGKRIDDRNSIMKMADFLDTDPSLINAEFLKMFNKTILPALDLIGVMPIGSGEVCKMIVDLSQKFSQMKRNLSQEFALDREMAASKSDSKRQYNFADDNEKYKAEQFMATIVGDPRFPGRFNYTHSSNSVISRLLPHFPFMSSKDLEALKKDAGQDAKNFDLVFMQVFAINTFKERRKTPPGSGNDDYEFQLVDYFADKIDKIEDTRFNAVIKELKYLTNEAGLLYDDKTQVDTRNRSIVDKTVRRARLLAIVSWMDSNERDIEKFFKTTSNFIVYLLNSLKKIKSLRV